MKFIRQFLIIILISFAGELLHAILPLDVYKRQVNAQLEAARAAQKKQEEEAQRKADEQLAKKAQEETKQASASTGSNTSAGNN